MSKAILGWKKDSDEKLLMEAQKIRDDLDGNPSFTELQPELPALKTAITDFTVAEAKSIGGSVLDTSVKKDKRKILEDLLYSIGLRMQDISKGDATKILSAGYRVKAEAKPAGELPAPTNIKITAGIGSLLLIWDVIFGAHSYIIEYTEGTVTNDSKWILLTSTKSKITINGLTSGKQYAVRIVAIGTNPTKNWSTIGYSFVL